MKKLFSMMMAVAVMALCAGSLFSAVQVGEPIFEASGTNHPYKGKGVVFEKVFAYPGAGYMAIHFTKFDLAEGDYVTVSSPDGRFSYIYQGKGKVVGNGQSISEFWATHIPGDTAVVRLHSQSRRGGFGFEIDQYVRGYEAAHIEALMSGMEDASLDAQVEAICSSDDKEWAKCYEGTEMYNKSRAVARLLMNGSSACTGWLVGSEGHLMTNNHCISTQTTANNTDYEFMAEGSCTTNCSGWLACPGTVEATSGTLVQTDSALDYSLILLPTNLTGTYGYLQLRDTLPLVGEQIYIPQHPGAYGKQLAVNSDVDGGPCEIYSTNRTPCTGGPGDIGYYCDTAGGSSGSPVLASGDHLVVSLHHCANCPNRGVPIPAIIADLGGNLPADAVGFSVPTAPAAPTGLNANARGKGKIELSWNDNSGNENGFNIYRGTTSGSLSLLTTVGANTTSFQNTGLTKGVTYFYKVCAFNGEGETCSGEASATSK